MRKDCTKPRVVCFGCGQDGHIKPNCPNKPAYGGFNKGGARPGGNGGFLARGGGNGKNNNGKRGRPFGKLNCTSLEEADNSETAVLGTPSLLTHYGKVLFDTGATTSFLAKHFMDQYVMHVKCVDEFCIFSHGFLLHIASYKGIIQCFIVFWG